MENTTADNLMDNQLWPPLDIVTVDQVENSTNQIAELYSESHSLWYELSTKVV